MSNVLNYPAVSTDDLADLSPAERDYRRKLRYDIQRGMPRHERTDERADRLRLEAKEAERQAKAARGLAAIQRYAASKQTQPANTAAADSAFLWQFVRAVSPVMNEAIAEVIGHERVAMRKHVAEQVKTTGELPEIQLWQEETIYKKGMLLTHEGSWFQAMQDTAQRPTATGSQWRRVVSSESALGAMSPALSDEMAILRDEVEAARLETDAASEAIGRERGERRKEFTASCQEMRRLLAAELAALEEREKQHRKASRAAVDQRIEQYNFTHKFATDTIREGLSTERNDRREEVAKEVGELRSALKAIGEAIAAERGARHDELAKAFSELRSQFEAMDKAIELECLAQRDEIARLREENSQRRLESETKLAAHEARETQRETAGDAWRAAIEQRIGYAIDTAHKELTAALKEMRIAFNTEIAAMAERLKGVPGRLPPVRTWGPETVVYEGEIAAYEGALYQARKDTAQAPGGSNWFLVARAGRDGVDGVDGRSPNIRGGYDGKANYAKLDVVLFSGESFLAMRDDPGICPGEDWQLLAPRGKAGDTGPAGPRGVKGDKGEPGAMIRSWQVDREHYRASPLMSDGIVGPMLELRELFEQYQIVQ